ncbi:hypothetical protein GCM10023063_25620 [Arthrobacter methylotrophus]|uniref:3-oxoacyl-[acyl-carrier-protein] synthase III C-terminal domain-containing protein n=1 Tax=Arthrobacter methylotrophus TaxID=121291 RepID=A0ABV5UJF9_9MICC
MTASQQNAAQAPARGSRIVGVGSYQPDRVLSNDELSRIVETSDEWIRTRVGIETRRVADTESFADVAIGAGLDALIRSGQLPPDSPVLLFGFGGGFSYAGQVIRTPSTADTSC